MDTLFTKQIHSLAPSTRLPLLHGLKRVLPYTNYSFGAIYETIDGPHCFGCQSFESSHDSLSLLTILGGERVVEQYAKEHQYRQHSSFRPEDLLRLSGVAAEPFNIDDLITIGLAIGQDGPYSPGMQDKLPSQGFINASFSAVEASYLVSVDITADADAHRALDSIGWSDFHRIPGWLSETLSEAREFGSSKGVERFLCIQQFEHQTNLHDVARVLGDFMQGSFKPGTGYANFKVRTYKLFGSAEAGT